MRVCVSRHHKLYHVKDFGSVCDGLEPVVELPACAINQSSWGAQSRDARTIFMTVPVSVRLEGFIYAFPMHEITHPHRPRDPVLIGLKRLDLWLELELWLATVCNGVIVLGGRGCYAVLSASVKA